MNYNDVLYAGVQARVDALLKEEKNVLVRLKKKGSLWALFYDSLGSYSLRREWSCLTCQQFISSYGDLGVLLPDNRTVPLFWSPDIKGLPEEFRASIAALHAALYGVTVSEPYVPSCATIGTARAGGFSHMAFTFPKGRVRDAGHDAPTALDKELLERVIASTTFNVVEKAYDLLTNDRLPHADKHKRAIAVLHKLLATLQNQNQKKRDNDQKKSDGDQQKAEKADGLPAAPGGPAPPESKEIDKKGGGYENGECWREAAVWRAALDAGSSCVHSLRNGVVGKLLEDLNAGLEESKVRANWAHMVDPANYMRPKALPTDQLIQEAEKLFAKLGISEKDLQRAYLCDLPLDKTIWSTRSEGTLLPSSSSSSVPDSDGKSLDASPVADEKAGGSGGLFGGVARKAAAELAPVEMSLVQFLKSILPEAKEIWYKTPAGSAPLYQFICAAGDNTVPLMQWHTNTNSVSWYTLLDSAARRPKNFGVPEDDWVRVTDVCKFPHLWDNDKKFEHFGEHRYLFVLQGAQHLDGVGIGLFPEFMRAEFHPYRAVVEQFSKQGSITPPKAGAKPVAGVGIEKSTENALGSGHHTFRVKNQQGRTTAFKLTSLLPTK